VEIGLAQLRQGSPAWRATGAGLFEPYFLGLQAEAQGGFGAAEEGLDLAAKALDRVEETGERWFEAELHRITGELMLRLPKADPGAAETQFEHAAATARQQGAKPWELRAAMSMARLWRDQGKRDEARELLASVYGWFTEGFDTRDLKEAKALLDELAA
jgi:predicted ATPase